MGMSLETVAFEKAKQFFHFSLVVDVFWKNVFIEGIPRRTVNEQVVVLFTVPGQLAKKIPPAGIFFSILLRVFQLPPRPKNSSFGTRIKSFGVKQSTLIVIPQQAGITIDNQIDALAGTRPVANDISLAIDFGNLLLTDILKDRLEAFEVTVDVADQCTLHGNQNLNFICPVIG